MKFDHSHIIFSADNGCNMEGYVGYNYEVTQKQSRNMLLGRSSATQFCNFNNIPYEVVDVGMPQMMVSEWIARSQRGQRIF